MPSRGSWNPLWLFLALKLFGGQDQRHARSAEPDGLAEEEGCWTDDWPDQTDQNALDWPDEDWQPDHDAPLGRHSSDGRPGPECFLNSDLNSPWD